MNYLISVLLKTILLFFILLLFFYLQANDFTHITSFSLMKAWEAIYFLLTADSLRLTDLKDYQVLNSTILEMLWFVFPVLYKNCLVEV